MEKSQTSNQPPAKIGAAYWASFALLNLLFIAIFLPAWRSMFAVWFHSETYSHCVLIPFISAWLIWRQRQTVVTPDTTGVWWAASAIFASMGVWLVGDLSGANLLQHAGIVGMTIASFPLVFGKGPALQWKFPILFLLFMIPAGEFLNPILMEYTADATVWGLRLSGVPVYREGLHFALPSGRWSVVEACSGLRYVIAAFVLALLFAHLNFVSMKRKVIFLISALAVSILANYVRAYVVVLVGHLSAMRYGIGEDHVYFGWAFFGVVMMLVTWAGNKWADMPDLGAAGAAGAKATGQPLSANPAAGGFFAPRRRVALLTVIACLVLGSYFPTTMRSAIVRTDQAQVISQLAPQWKPGEAQFSPVFTGDVYRFSGVTGSSPQVDVFVAYFANQPKNGEMISEANVILSSADARWSVRQKSVLERPVGGQSAKIGELQIYKGERRRLVWYWYSVGGTSYVSESLAKLGIVSSIFRGNGDQSTVSSLSVETTESVDKAREILQQNLATAYKISTTLSTRK